MSRRKPNQTRDDARQRVSQAQIRSLVAPSLEYLQALRQDLYAWIEEVDEKIEQLGSARYYEVIVGNVGSVHEGVDRDEAKEVFSQYVEMSKMYGGAGGRVSGEDVTLFEDGEPIVEHEGEGERMRR